MKNIFKGKTSILFPINLNNLIDVYILENLLNSKITLSLKKNNQYAYCIIDSEDEIIYDFPLKCIWVIMPILENTNPFYTLSKTYLELLNLYSEGQTSVEKITAVRNILRSAQCNESLSKISYYIKAEITIKESPKFKGITKKQQIYQYLNNQDHLIITY